MHSRLHALYTCSLQAVLEFIRPDPGDSRQIKPRADAGDTYIYESNANPIPYVSLLKHRQAANAWEECLLVRGMAEDGKHNFFRHRPSDNLDNSDNKGGISRRQAAGRTCYRVVGSLK